MDADGSPDRPFVTQLVAKEAFVQGWLRCYFGDQFAEMNERALLAMMDRAERDYERWRKERAP